MALTSPRLLLVLLVLLVSAGTLAPAGAARAQVISPGRLSEAHAHLEGMGNCTQCHQLRKPGIDPERCLACHEPLAQRVRAREGYHGRLADSDCGTCHKEHLGKNFRVVHFDAEVFAHDSTGYTLRGSHARSECGDCHRSDRIRSPEVRRFKGDAGALDRTYLGLGTECASCHAGDDPHGRQFEGRSCDACHQEERWQETPAFQHAQTEFALEGAHQEVECGGCHRKEEDGEGGERVRYRPLASSGCGACHEDPHQGGLPGRCDGCHGPESWRKVSRERVEGAFDHAATDFPLEGAHRDAPCGACHDPGSRAEGVRPAFAPGEVGSRSFPRPSFDACGSCHVDPHGGVFDGTGCEACHGQGAWTPSRFDLALHDERSSFRLTGSHRVTPCDACHLTEEGGDRALQFRLQEVDRCGTCHVEDDPHEGAFADTPCQVCHTTDSFLMETFDHDRPEVQPWIQSCRACHEEEQPHGDQFPERECGACHETDDFAIRSFDHSRTRFPLDGAHVDVDCGECHVQETPPGAADSVMVRYRPMDLACSACHRGEL